MSQESFLVVLLTLVWVLSILAAFVVGEAIGRSGGRRR